MPSETIYPSEVLAFSSQHKEHLASNVIGPLHSKGSADWATKTVNAGPEFLELRFPFPLLARNLDISELFNGGALVRVCARAVDCTWVQVWSGVAKPTSCSQTMHCTLATIDWPTTDFRLDFDTSNFLGQHYHIQTIALIGDAPDPRGLPLDQAAVAAAALLRGKQDQLISLQAQIATEPDPMKAKKKKLPLHIRQSEERIVELQSLIQELDTKVTFWRQANVSVPLQSFTMADVKLALYDAHIVFEPVIVQINRIDGPAFNQVRSEKLARSQLGIQTLGDCIRAVRLVNALRKLSRLPPATDIFKDGDVAQPASWSVEQFANGVAQGPLQGFSARFRNHKLAGDSIVFMNIELVAALMCLGSDAAEAAFIDTMQTLRARIAGTSSSL